MKKKILIAIAILAVLALGAFIVLKIMTRNAERHVETEKGIKIEATDLAAAYAVNEDSANKVYLDKTIELTGTIIQADSNENQQTVVIFNGGEGKPGISCTFKTKIGNPKPFSTLTCKGICTGMLSNVLMKDCIIVGFGHEGLKKNNRADTSAPKKDSLKPVLKPLADSPAVVKTLSYKSTKGLVKFDAGGGVEDIKATNTQLDATISQEGSFKFRVAILGFKFPDALMQKHFNEEYLESGKYPTASYTGVISNIKEIDLLKDGTYKASVTGNMQIHGVTQKLNTTGTITVAKGKISVQSSLDIKLADYQISTDATSAATITVNCNF